MFGVFEAAWEERLILTIAEQIAGWADKLRDLSAEGLRYTSDHYDQERYRVVQDIALAMLALATNQDVENLEPLRGTIFSQHTPLTGGDAAIIDDEGRILLIQRADNGKWAMPGGALQVGETPAEGVLREVWEETGIPCQALALVGIFALRPSSLTGLPLHVYLITFLCRPVGGTASAEATQSPEVLDQQWFEEDALPEDLHFASPARIQQAFEVWRQGGAPAMFDVPKEATIRV